jgi:FlaA1/EpsC-like NDP-sugar epimerase
MARLAARTKLALVMVLLDSVLVCGAYFLLVVLRFDAAIPDPYWQSFDYFLVLAAIVHIPVNYSFGLYSEMWRHASVNEARRVLAAGAVATIVLALFTALDRSRTPLSVPLVGGLLATAGIGILRFQSRLFALRRRSVDSAPTRLVVIGAGEGAAKVVREMRRGTEYRPVVVLDDDPRKWGMSLLGCQIVGPITRLPAVVERYDVDSALLAIPSAGASLVRRVESIAETCELPLKVLPSVTELLGAAPSVRDVRDLEIADLLGRSEVRTDLGRVRDLLTGRTVLVTGAGGSIGSEIVRQVSEFAPERLVLLDCDETHLHDAVAKVRPGITIEVELVNIRDRDRVIEVFDAHRPDVVLHAAALKHVPVLETNAREAVRTNVLGTSAVVEAAVRSGVMRFVNISTDKAVNPSSVMGATKWLGERLIMARAPQGSSWCCVRFGNVLGSRGSVLPTFERQIREGGPVTVTDPRMTRFFMSVQEAVQLVLQAGAMSAGRNIYMLEMGEPIQIADFARKMIRLTGRQPGRDIEIVFTGVRPGEKLAEELHTPAERQQPTDHPSITQLEPPPLQTELMDSVIDSLAHMVGSGVSDRDLATFVLSFATSGSALDGTALHGTALHGTALNGTALNGTALNGTALNGTALNGTALNGTSLHGSVLDGPPGHGPGSDASPGGGSADGADPLNGAWLSAN